MASSPVISILLPVRDGAVTLPRALQSIRAQTFSDWELLVIDDGSRDGSASIAAHAAGMDTRIRLISARLAGLVGALETGCDLARGEFIARMDADDVMMPQRLERQVRHLRDDPTIGLVSCLVTHGGDPERQSGYAAHVSWINSLTTPEQISLRRFVEYPVAHPSVMFRRELLQRHGGYRDGDFPEDYELWSRWLDAGVRFGKVPQALLWWNDSSERLSRVDPRYRTDAFYQLKCQYLARWLNESVGCDREIWLWGAGRVTRKRFARLANLGVDVCGFVDIDIKKLGVTRDSRPVRLPSSVIHNPATFVLAGVGTRGARELIQTALEAAGRREGQDYLLVA